MLLACMFETVDSLIRSDVVCGSERSPIVEIDAAGDRSRVLQCECHGQVARSSGLQHLRSDFSMFEIRAPTPPNREARE